MNLQIDLWQVISLIITFLGCLVGLGKLLLVQIDKRLEARFGFVERDLESHRRLENDFHKLCMDLPLLYVRRDDYVRGQTVIEAKLDALASKLEIVQLQGARNDH